MSTCVQNHNAGDQFTDDRLINGMRQSLKINYPRLFETAKKHWERSLPGMTRVMPA